MNSKLVDNEYSIPKPIVDSVKKARETYFNAPKGSDRAEYILNGMCSYHELKRLKNFFDYPHKISSKAEYELAGGDQMKQWVDNILSTERNAVKDVEKSRQTNDSALNLGTLKHQSNGLTVNLNENDSENVAGIAILVTPSNKILLLKRANNTDWMPGKWALVGGMVKVDEEPMEGIRREIKEETHLDVERLIEKFSIKKGNLLEYIFYGIIPEDSADKIIINDESDNFGLYKIEEIEKMDIVPNLLDYISLVLFNKDFESIYGRSQLEN